jgi:hypothetical protein
MGSESSPHACQAGKHNSPGTLRYFGWLRAPGLLCSCTKASRLMLHVHITEFVGKKYPKAKYRFSLKGSPITGIAGIWREGQGNQPPSFAMLTTAPGEDIAPYHNRQVVVLKPKDWPGWLQLTSPEAELLRPLPKGTLNVELVREGSD